MRTRLLFRVYAVAMYLPEKTTDLNRALSADGAKRIQLVALREIEADDFGKMFTRAMADNVERATFAKLTGSMLRLGEMFSKGVNKLRTGDTVFIDQIPGTGMVITLKGTPQPPFAEPEFFPSMAKIWLGPKPVDEKLKSQLLGAPA